MSSWYFLLCIIAKSLHPVLTNLTNLHSIFYMITSQIRTCHADFLFYLLSFIFSFSTCNFPFVFSLKLSIWKTKLHKTIFLWTNYVGPTQWWIQWGKGKMQLICKTSFNYKIRFWPKLWPKYDYQKAIISFF